MIIDTKRTPSQGETPEDSPPAYDQLGSPPPRSRIDQKYQNGAAQESAGAGPSTPRTPGSSASRGPSTVNKNWFGLGSWFSEKGTQKEVKQTIQSLIRDVVREPSSPAAVSVLQSCLEACQARGLSFQSIVSEKFIEGHSPLYWAIVKQPSPSSDPPHDQVHLLDIILSVPLNSTTRAEAYLACLLSSDHALFQRLRHTPGINPPSLSAADELLLGEAPEDKLHVQNLDGDHGEFRVNWKISQFQKRMRVIGGIGTEVVARGRIWSLAFTVLPRDASSGGMPIKAGSWVASVSLLAPSPPTYFEGQFLIPEPVSPPTPSPATLPSPPLSSSPSPAPSASPSAAADRPPPAHPSSQPRKDPLSRWRSSSRNTQKPPITLRVKTTHAQLEPLPLRSTKQDLREHVLTEPGLIVPLSSHTNGDSLQFDGCTYINPDDSLDVVFDARLVKSDTGSDCIIC